MCSGAFFIPDQDTFLNGMSLFCSAASFCTTLWVAVRSKGLINLNITMFLQASFGETVYRVNSLLMKIDGLFMRKEHVVYMQ